MRPLALALALALALVAPVAHAQGDATPEEPSGLDWLDQQFGTYFVAPMGQALFWDIVFWDNTLAPGEGIGQRVGELEVLGYEEGAYILGRRFEADAKDVTPLLGADAEQRFGAVTVALTLEGGALSGRVASGPVTLRTQDVAKLVPFDSAEGQEGITVLEGDLPLDTLFVSQLLAPFPVVVTPTGAEEPELKGGEVPLAYRTVRAIVPIPRELMPLKAGGRVQTAVNGEPLQAEIITVTGTALDLRSEARTRDSGLVLPNPANTNLPLVVAWLVLGAVFFTLRMQFINLRGFAHAIRVTGGIYDDDSQPGEITHFQALSSALSATVGLGNIAGVALAVAAGGPGAIFWMIIAGFLGMSSKFVECTLGQMYRITDAKGNVRGGPMEYLPQGLKELGMGRLGSVLGFIFTIMCIGGSLGGGNMFQANQSYQAVAEVIPWFAEHDIVYGVVLAAAVGMVIIGGVKRIGAAASLIVPVMCGIYVLAGLWILIVNADQLPTALGKIVGEAFTPEAGMGGLIGVLVQGFRRAAFSNEAGVGSASIAHSAAATEEPVREGIVALLEPFIDTIIVCTMTGLVVVITGAYKGGAGDGVLMTSAAFGSVISWFPVVLSVAVVLFAFSTMISWSYYGERCFTRLFGPSSSMIYRVIFLVFVVFGSVFKLGNVLDFSDLMILGMAFPNILGAVLLSTKVKVALDSYWSRLKAGEMEPKG